MEFGSPQRKSAPLGVVWMAASLALAAFLGAALGLVWQSAGFGSDEAQEGVVTGESPEQADG